MTNSESCVQIWLDLQGLPNHNPFLALIPFPHTKMSGIGPAFLPLTHNHPLNSDSHIERSRNWLFKHLHNFFPFIAKLHMMNTKNYCMKTNKQMKINNPKNITKFKVICIGWIHTHPHMHTKSSKAKDLNQNNSKWFPSNELFFIFTYPPKCEGGTHSNICVSIDFIVIFFILDVPKNV